MRIDSIVLNESDEVAAGSAVARRARQAGRMQDADEEERLNCHRDGKPKAVPHQAAVRIRGMGIKKT
jgi:hypothetical protein